MLLGDRDVKEYEALFNDFFPSGDTVEPSEREWRNIYNHRNPLDLHWENFIRK
ncbi:MAG: hypothetical protein IJM15_06695 [Erysipelotrichaceae bacterium]|nr:hypothetical protein [Erysipelotrichaceae bacterium]